MNNPAGGPTTNNPHFHIEGATPLTIHVTVDGEPFPWPIRRVLWNVDAADPGFPELTFTVSAGRITVDQDASQSPWGLADQTDEAGA